METLKEDTTFRISAKFKSYYVVWKHEDVTALKLPQNQFKSYYVVWKRENI